MGYVDTLFELRLDAFPDWFGEVKDQIAEIQGVFSEELSDQPGRLQDQLSHAEVYSARVNKLFADAKGFYALAKRAKLPRRGEGTDLDRETSVNAETAPYKRIMDVLEGYSEAISTRTMLGLGMLKANRSEKAVHQI